ncbi:RodZ family helix-turn-helix domain-containing protein [Synechococcus sp. A15-62]|uniref:helix-turn-helix domain-containing protein n=1 Tax=Synechococcus sp. A15-62 TaxID=1050657 RepID=UPI0021080440|nr:helix-turn-helix domain-containing protein [Synechococcus sp. A15-62]
MEAPARAGWFDGSAQQPMRLKRPGLWWRRPRKGSSPDAGTVEAQEQQRQDLGLMLRRRREELGLSLRDLANETRITTPVIEALERGWRDRLPERAYLASMLPQIERRLALPGGCLEPLLPSPVFRRGPAKAGLGRFTLGNIDVFTTWQGTVVYAAVIAFSLLAINRQQQDLALRNSLSLEPVRADVEAISRGPNLAGSDEGIAALRPLEQVQQRKPQQWFELVRDAMSQSQGVLEVVVAEPRALKLSSGGGDRVQFMASAGRLTLQLQAPIEVLLDPPAGAEDQVLWNGEPLTVDQERPGVYRVNKLTAPASDRPQTAPLLP